MGGVLLALERGAIDLAARGDLGGDGLDGAVAQGGGSVGGLVEQGNQLCVAGATVSATVKVRLLAQGSRFRAHRSVPRFGSQT